MSKRRYIHCLAASKDEEHADIIQRDGGLFTLCGLDNTGFDYLYDYAPAFVDASHYYYWQNQCPKCAEHPDLAFYLLRDAG